MGATVVVTTLKSGNCNFITAGTVALRAMSALAFLLDNNISSSIYRVLLVVVEVVVEYLVVVAVIKRLPIVMRIRKNQGTSTLAMFNPSRNNPT